MIKFLLIILSALFLSACGTGLKISRSKVKYIDSSLLATFENESSHIEEDMDMHPTLLHLFETAYVKVDSVHIFFNDSKELQFNYRDSEVQKQQTFKGNFSKDGYYEFYFRDKEKEIPPFIPILLSEYHIHRIRLALTIEGNLIVDDMWNESGSIFIFGGGSGNRHQYFFAATRRSKMENKMK